MAGGGSRAPVMTAYRQQALACAAKVQAKLSAPQGFEVFDPGCAEDAASQRLWLV